MISQLSTFPLGSSSGGFTYTFDESLGTFRRASSSFGPAFAERATTIGRGKLNAGITYQHTPYETFEGQRLEDGSIKFYLRHQECCSPGTGGGGGGGGGGAGGGSGPTLQPNGTRLSPPFEGDLIEASLSMEATTDTVAFFGNYGLTDRWDVALAVPIVRVDLEASVRATIIRLATPGSPLTHTFEAGNTQATERTFLEGGTATGLGDVLVRTRYRFLSFGGGGLAAAVDVRLPTGDQEQLLGAGTQFKGFLIASGGAGRFAPHFNIGYTAVNGEVGSSGLLAELGGTAPIPDEINYAMGMEFVAHPRVTIIGDVVGLYAPAGRTARVDQQIVSVSGRHVGANGHLRRVRYARRQPQSRAGCGRLQVQSDGRAPLLRERPLPAHRCGPAKPRDDRLRTGLRILIPVPS